MALEIEHKFLVKDPSILDTTPGVFYKQGYIRTNSLTTVRIRIIENLALLTVKGKNDGPIRLEFEYEISVSDANEMLNKLCDSPIIEKNRHTLMHENHEWVVDVFHGDNSGLIVAEIELPSIDTPFSLPHWIGNEVTDDPRYFNSSLAEHPYKDWRTD